MLADACLSPNNRPLDLRLCCAVAPPPNNAHRSNKVCPSGPNLHDSCCLPTYTSLLLFCCGGNSWESTLLNHPLTLAAMLGLADDSGYLLKDSKKPLFTVEILIFWPFSDGHFILDPTGTTLHASGGRTRGFCR